MQPTSDNLAYILTDPDCPAAHHPDQLDPMGDTCICLIRPVGADTFDQIAVSLGYVLPPACPECDGAKTVRIGWDLDHPGDWTGNDYDTETCPTCGGTGRQQLIPVYGIDWNHVHTAWAYGLHRPDPGERAEAAATITNAIETVIASLDKAAS